MQQLSLENISSQEPKVLTVSDINKAIKGTLETGFNLIWLKGELSNFKPHSSGHWYFSLKDEKSQISAVMFRGFNLAARFKPKDGMEVLVRGKVTVYEPRGGYQIFCELMEPVGAGAQQLAFEQLKQKLKAEGLLEPSRKKKLPELPQHIVVVTSPTGAAIRDILNVLQRRFKALRVTIVPTVVQGESAAPHIVKAIQLAEQLTDVDAMIIGRGGGSAEDMWCFNHESVARAIAQCRIPTISAVGHEIDFTISDFVADVRAPTPSAAAEMIVKSAGQWMDRIQFYDRQLKINLAQKFKIYKTQLSHTHSRLQQTDPKKKLVEFMQRCDELELRLKHGMVNHCRSKQQKLLLLKQRIIHPSHQLGQQGQRLEQLHLRLSKRIEMALERWRSHLQQRSLSLDNLSPLKVLGRGYAIARGPSGILKNASEVKVGDQVSIQLSQGLLEAKVTQSHLDLNGKNID